MKNCVEKKDVVVLVDSEYRKYLVDTSGKTDKIKGVGVLDPGSLVGIQYGTQMVLGNKRFWVLPPSLQDKFQSLRRRAQIILSRDAALIVMGCAIEPGQTVVEGGIGSGSLTIALANAVAPHGKVISYDLRDDFLEYALENVKRVGLERYVSVKRGDVTTEIVERDVDVVVVDIPNPWEAVSCAEDALRVGGYFCSYSPLISQLEQTVKALRSHGFIEIKTVENLQREMVVADHGTRPDFHMLGHTGYLTFARKVLEK